MKNVRIIFYAVLISGLIFTSCEKSQTDTGISGNINTENTTNPILTGEYRQALANAMTAYTDQYAGERSAEFLPIFFTSYFFGFFDDDLINLVTFSTELDHNDFLRENNNGTYTVHIASNNAFSELFNYSTFEYYYGSEGHMTMNYTGPAELIGVYDSEGNLLGYIYMVEPDENSPATVWHGNGKVQLGGAGPEKNLVAKLNANAGWKKVKKTVKLN
jgi:hypothetical protein